MDYALDLLALGTSCLALYFILRTKKTYFLDSGFFIGVANVGFIILLSETTYSHIIGSASLPLIDTSLISTMAISIGVASYMLGRSNGRNPGGVKELAQFVAKPPISFLAYLSIVASWTLSTLLFQPWTLNRVQIATGGIYYFYSYPIWYIVTSITLLLSFISFPVMSFYRQSLTVPDKKASVSMKIISVAWGLFGVITLFQIAFVGAFLPLSESVGSVADSFLFVLISFALKEPTIMGRIITAGETVSEAVYSHPDADTIVLYNTESDRKRLIETFVKDGLATGQDVACYVTKAEVPFYRVVLKSSNAPEPSSGVGQVTLRPIETLVPISGSVFPTSGSRVSRQLIDLDELDLEHCRDVIAKINTVESPVGLLRTGRIWALNVDGANEGILNVLMDKNPKSRVIDLARQQDTFSSLLSLRHQDILGNRLLLEYEPTSNYEEVVQKFVREFQANVESVAIFTSMGSPIYRQFRDQRNIRLFSFSSKTSTPTRLSEEQVLLPERDTSLLLDAVDKLLQAHSHRRIGVVFDVFTDLILSQGFEKAYGVISSMVEMSEYELSSILVLINYVALEDRALNGLRGLFRSEARLDTVSFKTIRLHGSELGWNPEAREPITSAEQASKGEITT